MQTRNPGATLKLKNLLLQKPLPIQQMMELIREGADPNVTDDETYDSLLHLIPELLRDTKDKTLLANFHSILTELVNIHHADMSLKNKKGFTPFQSLIQHDHYCADAMHYIDLGAHYDERHESGASLLDIFAASFANKKINDPCWQIFKRLVNQYKKDNALKPENFYEETTKILFDMGIFKSKLESIQEDIVKKAELIKESGGGKVYYGSWKLMKVAIKECYSDSVFSTEAGILKTLNEIQLASDKNMNIVHLHAWYIYQYYDLEIPTLVYEYMPQGDLGDFLKKPNISLSVKYEIACDIVNAVMYVHEYKLLHRDIKLGNVLISEDSHAYLSDFGLAIWIKNSAFCMHRVGTDGYKAPELLKQARGPFPYSKASDVFALGKTYRALKIEEKKCFPAEEVSGELKQFFTFFSNVCTQSLDHVPGNRPSALQIKEELEKHRESIYAGP